MKIGVFDSGIGGEVVARDLAAHFPEATIVTASDRANLPYGTKSAEDIRHLVLAALQPLLTSTCDAIVIACNTATMVALPSLRQLYPEQLFIGLEPMIKPAAAITKTDIICVCATTATLGSRRYHQLKQQYGQGITILEPDCHDWASRIENNSLNKQHILRAIQPALDQNADVIVLGCTHYHWIRNEIELVAAGRATIIEPTKAIARQIMNLLAAAPPQ